MWYIFNQLEDIISFEGESSDFSFVMQIFPFRYCALRVNKLYKKGSQKTQETVLRVISPPYDFLPIGEYIQRLCQLGSGENKNVKTGQGTYIQSDFCLHFCFHKNREEWQTETNLTSKKLFAYFDWCESTKLYKNRFKDIK